MLSKPWGILGTDGFKNDLYWSSSTVTIEPPGMFGGGSNETKVIYIDFKNDYASSDDYEHHIVLIFKPIPIHLK